MKTFSIGGVHPAENKLSAGSPIREAALPKQAIFSMFQHIGAPAKPVVKKGDVVKVGTLLGEAGGFVSAPIYSSVSGKVSKVDVALDASDTRRMAVYVDVEGDEWEESIDRSADLVRLEDRPDLDAKTIVEKIKQAGIVGMGGATFPCHVKLCPPPGEKAECVIINAVECEPYLTSDHSLMLEKADEISRWCSTDYEGRWRRAWIYRYRKQQARCHPIDDRKGQGLSTDRGSTIEGAISSGW